MYIMVPFALDCIFPVIIKLLIPDLNENVLLLVIITLILGQAIKPSIYTLRLCMFSCEFIPDSGKSVPPTLIMF